MFDSLYDDKIPKIKKRKSMKSIVAYNMYNSVKGVIISKLISSQHSIIYYKNNKIVPILTTI